MFSSESARRRTPGFTHRGQAKGIASALRRILENQRYSLTRITCETLIAGTHRPH